MSKEQLEIIKKEHEAMLAKTQNLQGQINGIDQQTQQTARKRQDLVDQLNQAATRTVELQALSSSCNRMRGALTARGMLKAKRHSSLSSRHPKKPRPKSRHQK